MPGKIRAGKSSQVVQTLPVSLEDMALQGESWEQKEGRLETER